MVRELEDEQAEATRRKDPLVSFWQVMNAKACLVGLLFRLPRNGIPFQYRRISNRAVSDLIADGIMRLNILWAECSPAALGYPSDNAGREDSVQRTHYCMVVPVLASEAGST